MPTRILKKSANFCLFFRTLFRRINVIKKQSTASPEKDLIKCAVPTANPATKQNIINSLNFACSLKYMAQGISPITVHPKVI